MLFMLIYYVMLVGQNLPLMAQNFNLMGKIWRKAFQQTRPSVIGSTLLNTTNNNNNKKKSTMSSSVLITPEPDADVDIVSSANLESPFKRSLVRFVFTFSIRCGRWFANNFGASSCSCNGGGGGGGGDDDDDDDVPTNEHKIARWTARLGSTFLPRSSRDVDFSRCSIAGVRCNIYRPRQQHAEKEQTTLPVIVFAHGGGWTVSSANSYHDFTSMLSRDSGAIVVSVDYSRAPERAWPHGFNDCLAVTRHVLDADTVPLPAFLAGRVDTKKVIVAGDSAGGNLAACVALDLIRANDRRLAGSVLICPCVQAVNFNLPSYTQMAPEYALDWFVANYAAVRPTEQVLRAMRRGEHLLPEGRQLRRIFVEMPSSSKSSSWLMKNKQRPPQVPLRLAELCSTVEAWPLLADDAHLAQMPPTLLQAARYDPMLDEDVLFARRLEKAGAQQLRFSIMEKGEHCESVFPHVLKTKAAIDGYNQVVDFVKEISSTTTKS